MQASPSLPRAILLVVCKDQPGIVAKITQFLFQQGGNIVDSKQHTDLETGIFFMRVEWEFERSQQGKLEIQKGLERLAQDFSMQQQLYWSDQRLKMAIFVSRYEHCLYDLLVRHASREIRAEIPFIISNHEDLRVVADHFEIPFHCIPIRSATKHEDEARQRELLRSHQVDFIVLARYMQILSPQFVREYPSRIINIHHSFLPAFIGAKPYHQAYARGVKVIGATSHYVTEQIDDGPIIEQSVTRVSHRDRVEDLVRKGKDQERVALAYAVRLHLEHRILVHENKTVIFD